MTALERASSICKRQTHPRIMTASVHLEIKILLVSLKGLVAKMK
jgi:hypothetical protein